MNSKQKHDLYTYIADTRWYIGSEGGRIKSYTQPPKTDVLIIAYERWINNKELLSVANGVKNGHLEWDTRYDK